MPEGQVFLSRARKRAKLGVPSEASIFNDNRPLSEVTVGELIRLITSVLKPNQVRKTRTKKGQ